MDPQQEQRLRDLARDTLQRQTFDWLYQVVNALALDQPLCLVLEDLHSFDEATLSLLEELLSAAEQANVCFLLVHRSDPDHRAWPLIDRARRRFRRLFTDIELEPLDEVEVRALAKANAGVDLPDEVTHLLAQRVGGNPYFVGEAIRDLRERGALRQENGPRSVTAEATFPAALQGALQARLDRLAAPSRDLIAIAAVIGRTFSLPLLERLLPRARLLPILSELQWLQLLVEERRLPVPEYRFRHGLVQEVAYGALVETRRRELHLLVGEALMDLHRDSPAEVYGLLAHHFAEADEPERAVEFLLKAGDAARALYAEDEAIGLYRRALGFMDRTRDQGRARETLLKIALTHHLAFEYAAANEAFGQAFARAESEPVRMAATERVTWAIPAAWDGGVAPGHSYSVPAFEITRNLFRGLVSLGRDLDIVPDLAERFSVSDDGLVYRFMLRPDARWSDGAPVTAEDFVFTFAQMVEQDLPTVAWLDGVSAGSVDDRTIEIRLRAARNDFLYALSQPPLFPWPRHAHERVGGEWHRTIPLVGNGAYVLTERHPDHLVMVAAPNWPGARGNVGEVRVEAQASRATAADRWQLGDYDFLSDLLTEGAVADAQTSELRSPGMVTWYLGFKASRPPFNDARVRRAFAHALDRHRPVSGTLTKPAGTGGLIPPTLPGHSHRVAPEFDPERARALLAEAGFAGGHGLGEIVLACLDLAAELAAGVAAQLAAIGIRAQVRAVVSDADMETLTRDGADAFLWAFGADYPDPGSGFLEPVYRHPSLYRSDELDSLLGRANLLRDQDERLRTYREFERIWIGEQAAVVPLAYGDALLWQRPWISGMWVNSTQISAFADAVVTRPPK